MPELAGTEENPRTFTLTGRIMVTVALLAAGAAVYNVALKFAKKAGEVEVKRPIPDVELVAATVADVPLVLESQGVIQAVTETRAAAEIAGRILSVCPQWDTGGSFRAGEELLRIDDADYRAALAAAEAAAAEAALAVRMEEERAAQAVRDWNKLATGKPDSDLVTRGPQLTAARARLDAAKAAADKARRDVERTVLRAPFDGRIRATLTDVGSWVAPGAPLAEFYTTTAWQVSLPLSVDEYTVLENKPGTAITLTAGGMAPVTAELLRTAGEIDRAARTIHVIASIRAGAEPLPELLQPGLYVRATLPGTTLKGVVKLPRVCLLPGDRAAVMTAENRLSLRPVKVARTTRDEVYLTSGVKAGDRVLATVLAVTTDGMEVHPLNTAPAAAPETKPAGEPAGKTP
jgi:RND family efflux transporter MFP subunit